MLSLLLPVLLVVVVVVGVHGEAASPALKAACGYRVAVAIDVSGSMSETLLGQARTTRLQNLLALSVEHEMFTGEGFNPPEILFL